MRMNVHANSTGGQTGYRLTRDARIPNTLRVPARARVLVQLDAARALPRLFDEPAIDRQPLFVLGGGSNVLFASDFEGAVVHVALRGIEEKAGGLVRVAAGESWDRFVRWSLAEGYAGLENLALIPGTVGAAPVQNIGAYGVELAEFVARVEAWDRIRGTFVELAADDCAFAYRDSLFRRRPGRYLITAVEFALPRSRALVLDYQGVREELAAMGVKKPLHADVARAIERLRLRKLPDPAKIGNAGSFFKNPVVAAERAAAMARSHPGLPVYPQPDGDVKLSAAWLIERCGLKGARVGDAALAERHALVLVNHGRATGAELAAFARDVRDRVAERFGVTLQPEPIILPPLDGTTTGSA